MSLPKRLDLLLLEKGLISTRTKAQDLIAAGQVFVNGRVVLRAGEKVLPTAELSLGEAENPYVSRGGRKLEAALSAFGLHVAGVRALDVGQSTGGFTDCLLCAGATAVVGVDVGHSQLAPKLRADPRVSFFERQDIRVLAAEQVAPPFAFFAVDVSFLSLAHVLPVIPRFLGPEAQGVVLMKPQFEVGPAHVGSGGIVRDAAARERALRQVRGLCGESGFTVAGELPCPVLGGDGNQEVLLHLRRSSQGVPF